MAFEKAGSVEQQLRELQDQFRELSLAIQRQQGRARTPPRYRPGDDEGGDDTDNDSVNNEYNPYGRHLRGNQHSSDIKVDIPEYDGRLDPDAFIDWLSTVERIFDYKHTTDEKKVKLVALKLRKYASTWWDNVCFKRDQQGKEKVRTWTKMKKLLKQKFMPTFYVQENFSKLHALKQGSRPVAEYSQDFEYLIMKCGLNEDDPQTLVRYIGGLEPRIANVVELHPYSTLAELTLMTHKVDLQHKVKGKYEANQTHATVPQNPSSLPAQKPVRNSEPISTPSKAPRRCFRCQGLGHIASECPNSRVITLAEFEAVAGPKFDEEPNEQHDKEEVVLGPDVGDLLVLRRALNGTAVHHDNLQRETLFRTRCTIRDKVCSLVIDGGSCTNVASQTMISKLDLSTEPHLSPYDIHWLNHGKGIRVATRVLVSLSIGKEYTDEIWCDVIPMDACHVLFGRPWLFDRRVVHDGYKNTYSFVKDGRQITLLPMMSTNQTQATNMFIVPFVLDFKNVNQLIQDGVQGKKTQCKVDSGISTTNLKIGISSKYASELKFTISSLRTNFVEDGEDDSNRIRVNPIDSNNHLYISENG